MTSREPWIQRWGGWLALVVVVLGALAIGTLGQEEPTPAERAHHLAETIRCPSCDSQAVASSDTAASAAVRALIVKRIEAGDTDEEIRDYVDSRYPDQNLLLEPSGSGFTGLVWALPVVLVVIALAGLVYRFSGYRSTARKVSEGDRELVAAALATEEERA